MWGQYSLFPRRSRIERWLGSRLSGSRGRHGRSGGKIWKIQITATAVSRDNSDQHLVTVDVGTMAWFLTVAKEAQKFESLECAVMKSRSVGLYALSFHMIYENMPNSKINDTKGLLRSWEVFSLGFSVKCVHRKVFRNMLRTGISFSSGSGVRSSLVVLERNSASLSWRFMPEQWRIPLLISYSRSYVCADLSIVLVLMKIYWSA